MTPEKRIEERRSVQSRLEQALKPVERSTEEKENWRGLDNTSVMGGGAPIPEPEAKRPTPPPPTPTPPPLSPQPAETQPADTYSNTHILVTLLFILFSRTFFIFFIKTLLYLKYIVVLIFKE
jgi:hypothetical protein